MKLSRKIKFHSLKVLRFFKKRPEELVIAIVLLLSYFVFGSLELKQNFESNNHYISSFTKWNEELNHKREMASADSSECRDITQKENLEEEIKSIEAISKNGQSYQGSFQGINLNTLPPMQAKLLNDFGQFIGDKSHVQNFSKCSDVICVFNEIYQDEEKTAGLHIYYWYLKTGSLLASSNILSGQESKFPNLYNDKKFEFKDYLFTKDELRSFSSIAYTLPPYLGPNPLLKTIAKIPDQIFERKDIKSCLYKQREGNVHINMNCLGNEKEKANDKILDMLISYNDLYQGKIVDASSLSHSNTFLDLALWEEEAYIGKDLKWKHLWTSSLPKNYTLENSQNSSPENFYPVLIKNYIYNPIKFQQNTSLDIAHFIKNDLFLGVGFDRLTLSNNILEENINAWDKKEITLWSECLQKFYHPNQREIASLDHPIYTCYQDEISKFTLDQNQKLKKSFHGCQYLSQKDFETQRLSNEKSLQKYINDKLSGHKVELKAFDSKIINSQNALVKFKENIDPTFALIHCHNREKKENCYSSYLNEKAEDLLEAHFITDSGLKKLTKEKMLALYPYKLTARKTNELMQRFLSPYFKASYFKGLELVQVCKKRKLNPQEDLKFPLLFSGGMRYIKATTLNCLNELIPNAISQMINDDQRIKLSAIEKIFISKNLKIYFANSLETIIEKDALQEKQKLARRFESIEDDFLSKIKKTTVLIQESYSEEELQNKCLHEIQNQVGQKIYYHQKEDVKNIFGRSICSTYIDDPSIKKSLDLEIANKWSQSESWAKNTYKGLYFLEKKKCSELYPKSVDSKLKNEKLKNICEENAINFAKSETKKLWTHRPEGEAFALKINGYEFL